MHKSKLITSNTKVNSTMNKTRSRTIGINTDDEVNSTNKKCTKCQQNISQPQIFFVPYIPCMVNPCFQTTWPGIFSSCCKCRSQLQNSVHESNTNAVNNCLHHTQSFQNCCEINGKEATQKHNDNDHILHKSRHSDKSLEEIFCGKSKIKLSVSNSSPILNAKSQNTTTKPKLSPRKHKKKNEELGYDSVETFNLPDSELNRYASELLGNISARQGKKLFENSSEQNIVSIDEVSSNREGKKSLDKLLSPTDPSKSSQISIILEENNSGYCTESENEDIFDDQANMQSVKVLANKSREFTGPKADSLSNSNQQNSRAKNADVAMLMMIKALVNEQQTSSSDSRLNKILYHIGCDEGISKNNNKTFPARRN